MKLSEAMREGSKLSNQCFGSIGFKDKTCALGAVAEWLEYTGQSKVNWRYTLYFPILFENILPPCGCCPTADSVGFCLDDDGTFMVSIAHLNDAHKWSREAIAEWVETIETKLEASRMAASERKTEETTSDTSAPVSTRQIESVHSSV